MQQPTHSIFGLCNARAEAAKARKRQEARQYPLTPSRRMWRAAFYAALIENIKRPTELEVFLRLGWAAVTKQDTQEQLMWRRLTLGVDKICQKCGEQKGKTEFYEHDTARDGRRNICKVCYREARNDNYAQSKIRRIEDLLNKRKAG